MRSYSRAFIKDFKKLRVYLDKTTKNGDSVVGLGFFGFLWLDPPLPQIDSEYKPHHFFLILVDCSEYQFITSL